jgi:hypothetical protein
MKKKRFDGIIVSVRFTQEQYKSLEKVCKYYRTGGKLSTGIRLAIEDAARDIVILANSAREEIKDEHPSNESISPTANT